MAGLWHTSSVRAAAEPLPAVGRKATLPSVRRVRCVFSCVAVSVTTVSPRLPETGVMSNPLPVTVSSHAPLAVTVTAASLPLPPRSTTSAAESSSRGVGVFSLLQAAVSSTAQSSSVCRKVRSMAGRYFIIIYRCGA